MIDLHTWSTPNGFKASIMLEECGIPYTVFPVNLREGEQRRPEFLGLFPNGKIPAIVDRENDLRLFESGAILTYLAEKSGCFLPSAGGDRYLVLQWLQWQVGGIGPMFGQASHFIRHAPGNAYGVKRYGDEATRLLGVLDEQLHRTEYVAGDDYSIADIMLYPWISIGLEIFRGAPNLPTGDWPGVNRWLDLVMGRPAVVRGMSVPMPHQSPSR